MSAEGQPAKDISRVEKIVKGALRAKRRRTTALPYALRRSVVPLDDGSHDADRAILANAGAGNGVSHRVNG